jgi:exonuclease SbcD
MVKVFHFADAHIDVANHGKHDSETGLPIRVTDFLKSLDHIVNSSIEEKADLVVFSGDAYKDRSPQPTFQREWGKRIVKLSEAKIPTVLLVGNHDMSPSMGRAHALEEFSTLRVPHVHIVDKPCMLTPEQLGVDVQVIAIPWVFKSGIVAKLNLSGNAANAYEEVAARLFSVTQEWIRLSDPNKPLILAAHASVEGAVYGGERTVLMGNDLVLPRSMVKTPEIDYVALGHIHKAQNLNEGEHPPVIYPGSIERVDFGEAKDKKYFVVAEVEKGNTSVDWRELDTRQFIDRKVTLKKPENVMENIMGALPSKESLEGAVVRLVVDYPKEIEETIDDQAIRSYASGALDFHLVKRPNINARLRLPDNVSANSLPPTQLLRTFLQTIEAPNIENLMKMGEEIIASSLLGQSEEGNER